MGCTHHNELDIAADDSFYGTVRRPLVPNPNSSPPKCANIFSTVSPPYYNFIHTTNLLPLNPHLGNATEQSRTHYIEQPSGSSRWNPTPEQLFALEEMYRRGTRTPSAEQIQYIATQLRRFGKIEGKNVFYWFQNHKARERQKRRREIENNSEEKNHETNYIQEKKDSGLRKTSYDVEETKNWASSSNLSKHSEEFVPMHRSIAMADNGPHGWTQFDERELQHRKSTNNSVENMNATWQAMDFGCPHLTNLMMSTKVTSSLTKLLDTTHHDHYQNLIASNSTSLTIKPCQENFNNVMEYASINVAEQTIDHHHHQTLELFPLHGSDEHDRNCSSADDDDATKKDLTEVVVPITTINTNNFTPSQYIEFLPLKN